MLSECWAVTQTLIFCDKIRTVSWLFHRQVGTLDCGLSFRAWSRSPRLMISGIVVGVALQGFLLTNHLLFWHHWKLYLFVRELFFPQVPCHWISLPSFLRLHPLPHNPTLPTGRFLGRFSLFLGLFLTLSIINAFCLLWCPQLLKHEHTKSFPAVAEMYGVITQLKADALGWWIMSIRCQSLYSSRKC